MSDEGEKTCPLCAEEMDLTDQQLKPCKCGYEICVWCWHHIMDMAEKDNTEGRCPACRTLYNKEKIVGTASKCDRLVTGMSVEKKQKSQKGKTKTSEGRKQLGSVRVIQRNLVYIVGLPLNLADEDLLQQKEYFGQYGKVLKVSISRTATGAIQQFANSTCSVYITYSKEEEAFRSIQSVHGFILEGRPLRACFGTTKYCHAWLRNAPCTNADCLYLHEFGPQEDSFSKDEIISAYTRNRVQQITGATNDMQRRSGNLLPPPADDYSYNTTSAWAKPVSKTTTNNPANSMKVSPPNSSSGRSVALPAAASWGARATNSQNSQQPIVADVASFKESSKPQTDTSSTTHADLFNRNEIVKKHNEENGNLGHPASMKKAAGSTGFPSSSTSSSENFSTSPKENKIVSSKMVPEFSNSSELSKHYSNPVLDKDLNIADEDNFDKNQRSQPYEEEQFVEPLVSNEAKDTSVTREVQSDYLVSDLQKKVAQVSISEAEEDILSFNDQRLRDTQVISHTSYIQNPPPPISPRPNNSIDQTLEKAPFNIPLVNGYECNSSRDLSNGHSYFHGNEKGSTSQIGESSIISNILSMDFDPWDESLTSPQNLAKFLGESNKQPESHRVLSSRKAQNSNQSRFSFAREDEYTDQGSNHAQGLEYKNFNSGFVSNNNIYGNDFSSFNYEESDKFANSYSPMSENKIPVSRTQVSAPPGFSGPSRAPPPGFTSHERVEQTFDNLSGNQMFDNFSLLRKTHQASAPVNIGGVNDLEFMDPAILAVGGSRVPNGIHSSTFDMRSNFTAPPPNSFENDIRLQLLMQRSFSQQNPRFTELGDNYISQQIESFGNPSRMIEQSLQNNISSYQQTSYQQQLPRSSSMMSNGSHWNGWNELQGGNDIAMAELLRNERLGYNRFYSGHEDTKFQMPTSGDLYNRTFGI